MHINNKRMQMEDVVQGEIDAIVFAQKDRTDHFLSYYLRVLLLIHLRHYIVRKEERDIERRRMDMCHHIHQLT